MTHTLKLGVNIDHVCTLRQARYSTMPDAHNVEPVLVDAAKECLAGGANSITLHLREDRRHVQDRDVREIRELQTHLNLEMGNTAEIRGIALDLKPDFVCLVPENRMEVTTEGGLDAVTNRSALKETIQLLQDAGILVSLFIDPHQDQVAASAELGANMIELHTGSFANAAESGCLDELARLQAAARQAEAAGLQVNAGHGITMTNLPRLMQIPFLAELNVGHHLVARALFVGLQRAVTEMVELMETYQG